MYPLIYMTYLFSFLIGFFTIMAENIFLRYYTFIFESSPHTYAIIVSLVLLGISTGALVANFKRVNERFERSFALGAACILLTIVVHSFLSYYLPILRYASLIFLSAVFFFYTHSFCLLLRHIKIKNIKNYATYIFCNVLGYLTSGIITCFIFDYMTLMNVVTFTIVLTGLLLIGANLELKEKGIFIGYLSFILVLLQYVDIWSIAYYKKIYPGRRFISTLESQHGVITEDLDHQFFTNGVYESKKRITLDLRALDGENVFAYIANYFIENNSDVYQIGLATGAWSIITGHNKKVSSLDVTEINKKFIDYVQKDKIIKHQMDKSNINLIFRDGRKYLADTNKKYDAMLFNPTFSTKNYASYLISLEFFTLAKSKLKENGFIFQGLTNDKRVGTTLCSLFKYCVVYKRNYILATDSLTIFNKKNNFPAFESFIRSFKILGKSIYGSSDNVARQARVDRLVFKSIFPKAKDISGVKGQITSDDNLLTEFK